MQWVNVAPTATRDGVRVTMQWANVAPTAIRDGVRVTMQWVNVAPTATRDGVRVTMQWVNVAPTAIRDGVRVTMQWVNVALTAIRDGVRVTMQWANVAPTAIRDGVRVTMQWISFPVFWISVSSGFFRLSLLSCWPGQSDNACSHARPQIFDRRTLLWQASITLAMRVIAFTADFGRIAMSRPILFGTRLVNCC